MLRNVLLALFMLWSVGQTKAQTPKTALLLIDIQDFYFEGGVSELVNPVPAAEQARKLLQYFRGEDGVIVHVKHRIGEGGNIHSLVKPLSGEKVIEKAEVNAFNGTALHSYLNEKGIEQVIIAGMQTHMCVEAAARAAHDLGYRVVVVDDACATKNMTDSDGDIAVDQVHRSTLITLKSYGEVLKTEVFLKKFPF